MNNQLQWREIVGQGAILAALPLLIVVACVGEVRRWLDRG